MNGESLFARWAMRCLSERGKKKRVERTGTEKRETEQPDARKVEEEKRVCGR